MSTKDLDLADQTDASDTVSIVHLIAHGRDVEARLAKLETMPPSRRKRK